MDNLVRQSASEVWLKILQTLQKELSTPVFERWIQPITPLDFENNVLCLGVPDEFFKTWIVDHYGGMISASLNDTAGLMDGQVELRIVPTDGAALAVKPENSLAAPRIPGDLAAQSLSPYENILNSKYTFERFVV